MELAPRDAAAERLATNAAAARPARSRLAVPRHVLVNLYAIHRILGVTERAMAGRRVVPSVPDLVYFPFSVLGRVLPERRRERRGGGAV
jgi:hypothetical protein